LNKFGNIDSKYRYIILASKRAKQLLKGAKPKIQAKSRNLIRIAQAEVKAGLIEYEILPEPKEDVRDTEDRIFVGDGLAVAIGEPEADAAKEPDEEPAEEAEGEAAEEEGEEEEGESEDGKDE
jgi:DNA-directed RNA polymerase subunit K/omega